MTSPQQKAAGVLERQGCPLHFWLAGPPDAPLVAFTHGVLMDHRVFVHQVPELARRYRVLTWDVRGHGRSRPLGRSFSIARAAGDLEAILDHVGADRAALVGHSMGGYISQELALRQPDRVSALIAVSASPLTGAQPLFLRLGIPLSVIGFRLAPDRLIRRLITLGAGLRPEVRRDALEASRAVSKREFDAIWPALVRGFRPQGSCRPDLPLLLMHGDRDDWVAFGALQGLTRRWASDSPWCRYRVIPNAGHNAHQDNPEFFNRELIAFLQGVALKGGNFSEEKSPPGPLQKTFHD